MSLKGKKIGIFVANGYEDLEFWYPYLRMREEEAEITLIGVKSRETYEGKHGYKIKSDKGAEALSMKDLDALIIPGGKGPEELRQSPAVLKLAKGMLESGKLVAAICHGPLVLVSAGVLKGRTLTGYRAVKGDIIRAGAKYLDQEVVVDGNLITSRQPADLPAFCRRIIDKLK